MFSGLDPSLIDSIKKREVINGVDGNAEGDLMTQITGLIGMSETVLADSSWGAAGEAGTGAGAGAGAGGRTVHGKRSAAIEALEKMTQVLQQKEADLELAAKIGDALFQENTRLRQERNASDSNNRNSGSFSGVVGGDNFAAIVQVRVELEKCEEELYRTRKQCKALSRKADSQQRLLEEADRSNAAMADELENIRFSRDMVDSGSVSSALPKLSVTPPHSPAPALSSVKNVATTPVSPFKTDNTGHDSDEENDLTVAREGLAEWRRRALAVEAERDELKEAIAALRSTVEQLEKELSWSEKAVAEADMKAKRNAMQEDTIENDTIKLTQELARASGLVATLEKENEALARDLEEHKTVLSARDIARPRGRSRSDFSDGSDGGLNDSLAAELADIGIGRLPSKAVEKDKVTAPTPKSEDPDLFFFHFHMTAMSVKAHLSLSRQSQRTEGGRVIISNAALDTINALDTKEMYKEVLANFIPPHHWIGYIRDCFSRAHLKSLLKSKKDQGFLKHVILNQGAASSKAEVDAFNAHMDDTFAGSQSYLEPTPPRPEPRSRTSFSSQGGSASASGKRKSSYFPRLLGSMTRAASPLADGALDGAVRNGDDGCATGNVTGARVDTVLTPKRTSADAKSSTITS